MKTLPRLRGDSGYDAMTLMTHFLLLKNEIKTQTHTQYLFDLQNENKASLAS